MTHPENVPSFPEDLEALPETKLKFFNLVDRISQLQNISNSGDYRVAGFDLPEGGRVTIDYRRYDRDLKNRMMGRRMVFSSVKKGDILVAAMFTGDAGKNTLNQKKNFALQVSGGKPEQMMREIDVGTDEDEAQTANEMAAASERGDRQELQRLQHEYDEKIDKKFDALDFAHDIGMDKVTEAELQEKNEILQAILGRLEEEQA